MRYRTIYDDKTDLWAVIDTRVGSKIIQRHNNKKEAMDAAWFEEERWYKCTPLDDAEIILGASGTENGRTFARNTSV